MRSPRRVYDTGMRCPLCRGWVGLQAATCACGFDLASGDVGGAVEAARGVANKAVAHLAVGLAAGSALVLLAVVPPVLMTFSSTKLAIVLLLAAVYGVGRGVWLLFDARRRLALAERMRTPPAARVVRGGGSPGA